jgi:hypothetical protein
MHGTSALLAERIDWLLGRTTVDDNCQIFWLMRQASGRYGYGASPWTRQRAAA